MIEPRTTARWLLLAGCLSAGGGTVLAQGGEMLLHVGEVDSPLISRMAQYRETQDALELVQAARRAAASSGTSVEHQRREDQKALQEMLRGSHSLAVDLRGLKPHPDHRLLLDAAQAEGLPIALENASSDTMLDLMDVGIDAPAVVVVSDPATGVPTFHIVDDSHDEVFDHTPEDDLEDDRQARLSEQQHVVYHVDPQAAGQGGDPSRDADESPFVGGEALPPLTDDAIHATVEQLVSEMPHVYGARSQTLQKFTGQQICNGAPRCNEKCFNLSPVTYSWSPNRSSRAMLGLHYCYATVNASTYDWFVVRTRGNVGAKLGTNKGTDRGYYVEDLIAKVDVTLPSGWSLDRSAPDNVNRSGSYSSTTGFTLGAEVGGGVDSDGPSGTGSVSASYSASSTQRQTITDFRIENKHYLTPDVRWDYELQSVEGQRYDSWSDLVRSTTIGKTARKLPSMAENGFQVQAEAVWRGPAGQGATLYWSPYQRLRVRHVWRCGNYVVAQKWCNRSSSARRWYKSPIKIKMPKG